MTTLVQNPTRASWVNPVQATNPQGQLVTWDPNTDEGAVAISFDGGPNIIVTVPAGTTSLDLTTLPAFTTLPSGQHSLTIADVTKEGGVGLPSTQVTFLVTVIPNAPTNVTLA